MDFTGRSRAMNAKYGKNKGRSQLQNFYDIPFTKSSTAHTSDRLPISPSSAGNEPSTRDNIASSTRIQSPSPARSPRPAHVTSHSGSSASSTFASRPFSPMKHNLLVSNESTFDILSSSDDDHEVVEKRPLKRLRLSPVEKEKKTAGTTLLKKATNTDEDSQGPILTKKHTNLSEKHQEKSSTVELASKRLGGTRSEIQSDTSEPVPVRKLAGRLRTTKPSSSQDSEGGVESIVQNKKAPHVIKKTPDSTPRKSRTKLKPRANRPTTPKKQEIFLDDASNSGASPSRLGLGHLRLTPGLDLESSTSPSPPAQDAEPVLPRGRKRLIDRLDTATNQSSVRAELAANNFAREIDSLHKGTEKSAPQAALNAPPISRSESSQSRQTYGRSRNTYGKERSHLSDIVDDLDALSSGSHPGGSQGLLSGMISAGPSQLQSHFDMESDTSDDGPNFRLKSVHELKQAGTNNRLEKEVEDLMSDVNPNKGSKVRRIQAFMLIIRKLTQEKFLSFLLDSALDRLISWSLLVKDKISKLLLGMVFWRLSYCETISSLRLKQLIQGVLAISSSLPPLDPMSSLARDKSEQLPRSVIRELSDFNEAISIESLLPAHGEEIIIPAVVTLGTLNDCLRKLIDHGSMVPLPQSSFAQIIALLEQVSRPSGDLKIKHAFVTKLALSLLQTCAGPLEQDLGLSDAACVALGDNLADLVYRIVDIHEDLIQAVLHFTISVCNDKPQLCRAMCQSKLSTALMSIVDSRFFPVIDVAQASQKVESNMLDSIILTLACLLTETEHDDEARQGFAYSKIGASPVTHLSRLVKMYSTAATKLTTISTAEQGSALVVLGYLSLLICNLCLNAEIWQVVSDQLPPQQNISDIVASAKELLIHLRMVETQDEINADEKSGSTLDGFTTRFGQILDAVRLE